MEMDDSEVDVMPVIRRRLTSGQQLRKLQLAINHIAAVIDDAPGDCIADLSEALDLIHQAEGSIEDERDAR